MRIIAGIFATLVAVLTPAVLSQTLGAESSDTPEEQKIVQIVLYPAAEPRPALKYQLLPPLLERRAGNAAVWWNRIPAEQGGFFDKFYAEDGPWSRFEKWMEIPIGDPYTTFKGQHRYTMSACICRGCEYTELYAHPEP